MMLRIKNLKKSFGDKEIFSNAELIVHDKDRIALLGQNGTGKSTLFNCIAGIEDFQGSITLDNKPKVAIMEQEKSFDELELTFEDYINRKKEKIDSKLKELELQIGNPEIYSDMDKYDKVMNEYELLCSRTVENIETEKLKTFLNQLGFSLSILTQKISTLSGGQKTALRLSECLAKDADFLLLDEPTNHLDFKSRRWLESYLISSEKTVIVISHDRYFLDRFVNKVVEIENNVFQTYNRNYTNYLIERAKHRQVLATQHAVTKKQKEKLLASMREKRQWAHKECNRGLKLAADNLERRANNLPDTFDPRDKEAYYLFKCKDGPRSNNLVFETKNISKSFGNQILFDNVSVSIYRGEKVAVIGDNGVGKTTLLKVLTKQLQVDLGTVNNDIDLRIGYFDQESKSLNPNDKVLDYLMSEYMHFNDYQILSLARKFGFEHDIQKKKIKSLSGGEKARLQLLKIMLSGYNILVLDEPTNHLDLELREALEKALKLYEGTIVFVSHDRYFIDKIATKLFKISYAEIKEFEGNYSTNFY